MEANTPVKIYNHNVNDIGIKGQLREYLLPGSRGVPTVLTMPFSEVEYVNSRSPIFRNGTGQFDPETRESVYKALYLDNWQDTVLFDEEIERIIRENDMDSAEKFLNVTDVFTIQRIRGHLISLTNDSDIDISRRMIDLIEFRYDEINHGIRQTKWNMAKAKERMERDQDPRIAAMQAQIAEMQKMITTLQSQANLPTDQKETPAKTVRKPSTKKVDAKAES